MVSKAHKVMPESITDMTSVSTGKLLIYLFIYLLYTIQLYYTTIQQSQRGKR